MALAGEFITALYMGLGVNLYTDLRSFVNVMAELGLKLAEMTKERCDSLSWTI